MTALLDVLAMQALVDMAVGAVLLAALALLIGATR